jgi:ABC transport system ATP-binding/permease protein
MHVLSVTGLEKAYDGDVLFEDVAFGLGTDDHVGLIGPNGSGKTTLLEILAGRTDPDAGEVVRRTGARIAHLPQRPDLGTGPALEVVLADSDRTVRRHEAEAMLDRLGLAPDLDVATMSGGQRRRVAIARLLVDDADLLLLDEPTNHLDVETIAWLEDQLRARNAGIVMVTHDRYFLERLTNRMLEIDPAGDRAGAPGTPGAGAVHWHEGTYSDVLAARAERERLRAQDEARRQNLLRKEIAWLRRAPKARTSKPKFRQEQAAVLQAAALEEEPVQLALGTGRRRLGTQVVELEDVTFGYDPDQPVVRDVSFGLGPGDRVGIVGPNGSGKTTLLRLLTGELEPDEGRVRVGPTVEFGTYEQEATVPPVTTSVLDTVTAVAEWIPLATGERLSASRLAERFGFDPRLQRASVARLSGGERRRLALLHMLVAAPNVLVLDEPTNDLDLDTLAVLEDHLDGFSGTLVVASHDRYVLDRLTDELLAIDHDGRVRRFLDWDAYRSAVDAERERADAGRERRTSDSAADNRRRVARQREVRSVEQRMDRLEGMRAELHEAMAGAGSDHEQLRRLHDAARAVDTELAELEERWLQLSVGSDR